MGLPISNSRANQMKINFRQRKALITKNNRDFGGFSMRTLFYFILGMSEFP